MSNQVDTLPDNEFSSEIRIEVIPYGIECAHTEDVLVNMFRRNFTGAPRRETWSDASARQFIRSHYCDTSVFVLAYVDSRCVGAAFGCHAKDSLLGSALLMHTDGRESFYISTVMVDREYREKSIATRLVAAIEESSARTYGAFIARTRLDIINAMVLFLRNGYRASEPISCYMGGELSMRVYHVKYIEN